MKQITINLHDKTLAVIRNIALERGVRPEVLIEAACVELTYERDRSPNAEVQRLHALGYTTPQIAASSALTNSQVYRIMQQYGLKANRPGASAANRER